mmetsp:Transcript_3993/g.12014  ORF Transcript_3993/g.12014 Transcript_3993/m.12014 type:complete len:299 (-) Transcript_3993:218-1114(-)
MRVRRWNVLGGQPDDLVVQLVDEVLADRGAQRGADAAGLHALLHDQNPSGLLERVVDGLQVKRLEGDQVDDLGIVALGHEVAHGLHGHVAHPAVAQDGDVRALPHDLGPVELLHLVLAAHGPLDVVQEHVLKEDDGVVRPDGRLEQRLGVPGRGASHKLHSRDGLEVRLEPLRVLRPELPSHASRATDHHRDLVLSSRRVVEHAAVVGDLVEGQEKETHVHALDHGPQTGHGGADAHASKGVLRDRRVQQPHLPVLLVQIVCHFVGTTVVPDVLAHHKDGWIPLHLLVGRLPQRLPHQ